MSEGQSIAIRANDDELKGRYANGLSVTVQERDIVIDFLSTVKIGNQINNSLVSRIFLNHFVAAELVKLLEQTRKQWEDKRFGASG